MEYKSRQWHEKCFCCCVCKTPIGTKSFIPRDADIYCAGCYEEKFATRCVKCDKVLYISLRSIFDPFSLNLGAGRLNAEFIDEDKSIARRSILPVRRGSVLDGQGALLSTSCGLCRPHPLFPPINLFVVCHLPVKGLASDLLVDWPADGA